MIVVDKVTKFYGPRPAVRDLDFKIDEGECVGFLGLNGAGKSTTLRLLSCLLLPTSGRITIRGLDAEEQPHEIRKLIGYLPDTPPLYPEMRVTEFLRFAGQLRQMKRSAVDKRMPEVVELTGLRDVVDQPIGTLSHGYKQRVGIAQAIVHDPALLILDEPIQGLDPVQIVEMRQLIRNLRGKHTILLSSHILSEIEQTCDRVLMLHRGRITAQGTEDEVVAQLRTAMPGYRQQAREVWLEVEIRGDEASVRKVLGSVGGAVTELGIVEGELLRVKVQCSRDIREEAARAIIQAGLGLRGLREIGAGKLEDVFVELSRKEESKEAQA
ncbi:MAG: ABC transporter ATP-binding protein [Sandaracinaceae bacterium]|nr:ABC transporter ATP-binding protein [Sandaracinaceae bacterium]